jgi:hypothetical protein
MQAVNAAAHVSTGMLVLVSPCCLVQHCCGHADAGHKTAGTCTACTLSTQHIQAQCTSRCPALGCPFFLSLTSHPSPRPAPSYYLPSQSAREALKAKLKSDPSFRRELRKRVTDALIAKGREEGTKTAEYNFDSYMLTGEIPTPSARVGTASAQIWQPPAANAVAAVAAAAAAFY